MIELKESRKLILNILRESEEAAKQNVILKGKAVNDFAVICANELGVDMGTHVLDLSSSTFIPRPEAKPAGDGVS